MISIQTYTPKALSHLVKSFWCLRVSDALDAPYVEEILPDGHHEIVFHFNSTPQRKKMGSTGWLDDPALFFSGQNKKSYIQQMQPGAIIYAVRFHPHTQALFYDFPAALGTDTLIALKDVAPADNLWNCFSESPEKTFASLEKEFEKRAAMLGQPTDTFRYVNAAVHKILSEKGNLRIGSLERLTGVSGRHLEKSFQRYVGLSPKQLCNIIKYSHFITYRKNHPGKSLTECAYEAEFHDQSHLIHLSNSITGQSPKAYFGKLNYINDFFLDP